MKIIQNNKGEILYVWMTAICLFLILGVALTEILRVREAAWQIRAAGERAIVSGITRQWKEVFSGVREGYSASFAYEEASSKWKKMISPIPALAEMKGDLGLNASGLKEFGGGYLYQIKDFKVTLIEVLWQDKSQTLEVMGVIRTEMVLGIGGLSFSMDIPIQAKYQRIF